MSSPASSALGFFCRAIVQRGGGRADVVAGAGGGGVEAGEREQTARIFGGRGSVGLCDGRPWRQSL